MFATLTFQLPGGGRLEFEVRRACAAGATARDPQKARAHIERMARQGVKPPPHVPMLYPLMPTLVTNASDVGVIGVHATPEVEVVFLHKRGTDYITVGSDHTDRRIEAASSLQGKNSCPKIVGSSAWPLDSVRDHWDRLELRATCGATVLQEGSMERLLRYDDLLKFVERHDGADGEGRVVFGGTVPTLVAPPPGKQTIELALHDPVSGRSITHRYTVHVVEEFFPSASS